MCEFFFTNMEGNMILFAAIVVCCSDSLPKICMIEKAFTKDIF